MRRSPILLALISISILLSFQSGFALAKTNKKTTKYSKQIINKYDVTAFDLSRSTLPLAYSGHDAMKLYTALNKLIKITKSEFETTEQFNNRNANSIIKPIVGKLTADSIFAFMIKPRTSNELIYDLSGANWQKLEYDADKQLISFELSAFPDVKIVSNKRRTYNGTNGYGATVQVSSYYSEKVSLKLTDSLNQFESTNGTKNRNNYINISLEGIAPKVAKEYKDNLRLLVIAKLEEPYTSNISSNSEATYNDPAEFNRVDYRIHCRAIEIWLYNFKTGAVLKKIKSPETPREPGGVTH